VLCDLKGKSKDPRLRTLRTQVAMQGVWGSLAPGIQQLSSMPGGHSSRHANF
jgi:hypothetical protein